jgi:hypothetical protein
MTDPQVPLPVKAYAQASVFEPANLLREARRQKNLPDIAVPRVCLLDPDGDIAAHLESSDEGRKHPGWACYHTDMWVTDVSGTEIGVVGRAVGASFAVLVAEQLFASGAELVISITSAGQLQPLVQPPYFVLIDKALRDEGTNVHYRRLERPARSSRSPALEGTGQPRGARRHRAIMDHRRAVSRDTGSHRFGCRSGCGLRRDGSRRALRPRHRTRP